MIKKIKSNRIAGMIRAFVVVSGLFVTNVTAAAPRTVSMTVTAVGKKDTSPPLVTKDDVQLYLNKERTQIADWKHGGKLYLAVLIDDSLAASIANQWNDLKAFLTSQPDTTYVSVSYARNGTAMLVQDFTNDHELATKALRIPLGGGGAFSSPYLTLLDLMKRWPASADRRSILLISSGIDYFRGGFDYQPRAKAKYQRLDNLCSGCGAPWARILHRQPSAIESQPAIRRNGRRILLPWYWCSRHAQALF